MGYTLRRAAVSTALILLAAWVPSAQQAADSPAQVAQDLVDAHRLFTERKYNEATAAYQAVIESAHRLGLDAQEADGRCGLGETLNRRTKYADAQPVLRQCLEIAERMHDDARIGRASVALSQAADLTGQHPEATAFADRAVTAYDAIRDAHGRATARLQVLRVRMLSVDEEKAMTDLIIADARSLNDPVLEADGLHFLGDRYFNADRFEDAFAALTRARDLYHQAGSFGDEGTTLNSLGRVYRAHGRLDEALKYQRQALALHEKYGTPFELMQSHNAVAVVLNQMDDLRGARDQYERALTIARDSGSPRIQDFLNANLASLLVDMGEYENAARTMEAVIARGLDAYPGRRYSNLAFTYMKLNRPADALAAAERAVAMCGDDQILCVDAMDNRADAHAALGDYAAASADLRSAMDTIEALRGKLVPSDFLKQNFHEALRNIYSASIAIAFRRHDDRGSLETSELASSRALLDLLAARRSQAEDHAPVPDLTTRGAATRANDDLSSPAMGAPATAEDLVAVARRLGSTLLVYWPADHGLFMWVVEPDGRIVSRRSETSSARLIQLIRDTGSANDEPTASAAPSPHAVPTRGASQILAADPADRRAWRQLYDLLIAPIRNDLPRQEGALLTVIAHGPLMNLSFAALQDRRGRYLLEDYAIHYAPAGAVLRFTAGMRRGGARAGTALLVADPATVRRSVLDPALPPLPGARDEVARIAAFIPGRRVTLLEGRDATEPRVAAAAAGKSIVHLATHAIVRDDAPNDSYLAFGPSGASKTGLLTAHDVYGLRLDADLVVLSACRSGGGRVTGDGVATFARAFLYAGTPSLVVSLWDVADEPTSRLLPAFYRSWLAGASKARSMRRAQLQLLADLRAGAVRVDTHAGPIVLPEHPIFWAGFILIGEPE